MGKKIPQIILASKSPRRKELLEDVGIKPVIVVSEADENISENDPRELVKKLSLIKAQAVYENVKNDSYYDDYLVLGADTVVYSGGRILGKPSDKEDARNMIKELSGRSHSVFTGFTVIDKTGKAFTDYAQTLVYVYEMSDEDVEEYISTKEPYDKAGAYGIQGLFKEYVEKIEGDYNNVVGLPVAKILQMIRNM